MSIDSINNSTTYSTDELGGIDGLTKKSSSNNTLQMDDFFSLIVAQLKNQDMYNTVDNTQYIAQMAQFSMIQALADLSELSMTSYGVSLIGKEVTIAKVGADGKVESFKGLVDSVNFFNGSPQVVVEKKSYSLSSVMAVKEPDIIIPDSNITNPPKEEDTVKPDDVKDDGGGDGTDPDDTAEQTGE